MAWRRIAAICLTVRWPGALVILALACSSAKQPTETGAPSAALADAVSLDELPRWRVAADAVSSPPQIVVHAADAPGHYLQFMVDEDRVTVAASPGESVSGTVTAPWPSAASAALTHAYPSLAPSRAPPGRRESRGTKVDFHFFDVDARDLVRLLADVLGINIVVGRADLPHMVVFARSVPADGLLAKTADVLNLNLTTWGNTAFLSPRESAGPNRGISVESRARIDMELKGATVGEGLVLLGQLLELPVAGPCGVGPEFDLRMRRGPGRVDSRGPSSSRRDKRCQRHPTRPRARCNTGTRMCRCEPSSSSVSQSSAIGRPRSSAAPAGALYPLSRRPGVTIRSGFVQLAQGVNGEETVHELTPLPRCAARVTTRARTRDRAHASTRRHGHRRRPSDRAAGVSGRRLGVRRIEPGRGARHEHVRPAQVESPGHLSRSRGHRRRDPRTRGPGRGGPDMADTRPGAHPRRARRRRTRAVAAAHVAPGPRRGPARGQ